MLLKVKITPNSHQNKIIGWLNDALKIKIAAPPQKGKANKELIDFLSDEWNIPKRAIEIKKGHTSSLKLLNIDGLGKEKLEKYKREKQERLI